ncbi:MAG: TonB-dependent receptor [Rubricoccaceae bacterium]
MFVRVHSLSLLLLLAAFFSLSAVAQTTGRVAGTVVEAETNRPLVGVNILLQETSRGAISDSEGRFEVPDVPAGAYTLRATSVGFSPLTQSIQVVGGQTTTLALALTFDEQGLGEVTVEGRGRDLVGRAGSASEGLVGQEQLEIRPLLRVGEVLETVPGVIVTQHSGAGKANQFFLRGFNLDHGTDFSASVEGVPINLPTHAHGQGYLDLNFLIPEVIEEIEFVKGPLNAESGDFATAGRADIRLARQLDASIVRAEVGTDESFSGLVATSAPVGEGDLLVALKGQLYDGPWVNPENNSMATGVAKYSAGTNAAGYSVTAMGYFADWDATDQVALRAVQSGQISRLGALDPTTGGTTGRYTLAGKWYRASASAVRTEVEAFAAYYHLNLFSNFTYFLDNPVRGDQFEQADRRLYSGATVRHIRPMSLGMGASNTIGATLRHDQIFEVGLHRTQARTRFATVRDDAVGQSSLGLFAENETRWTDLIRTTAVLRGDVYRFDVNSGLAANSGEETAFIASPRLGIAAGPWSKTEVYANAGFGFHSNDARGSTIQVDPVSGEAAEPVDPLVRTRGVEAGVRTSAVDGLKSALALWMLDLESELLFVGDAGGTEASDASRHIGVEWTNYYEIGDHVDVALDIALTRSRFVEGEADGERIENSIGRVITGGIYAGHPQGAHGSLQVRHFGPRPLTGDGSVFSDATTLVNARLGYGLGPVTLSLDVLNLLDAEDVDVSYFYASRLAGEPAEGVEDVHAHPVIPRAARLTATVQL